MEYILILLASFLLFSKSKYFPKKWKKVNDFSKKNKMVTRLLGYTLLIIAAILLVSEWGSFTGLIVWITTIIFAFNLVVMIVPTWNWMMNKKPI